MNYTPLAENGEEIRLLTIVPQSGDSDIIHCQLLHYTFKSSALGGSTGKDSPWDDYMALSYTWGSPDDLAAIVVNGSVLKVRPNLRDALYALRNTAFVESGGKLWVDALCLNQEDVEELNREVSRMRDIYRNAVQVVIWLGGADQGSDDAIDFINDLSSAEDIGLEHVALYIKSMMQPLQETLSKALTELVRRNYWHRVWIIQELSFGGEATPILCGDRATTWRRMLSVFHHLNPFITRYRNPDLAQAIHHPLQDPASASVYSRFAVDEVGWEWIRCDEFQSIQQERSQTGSINTKMLISRSRTAGCQKPADKVYGILGLLRQDIAQRITPDYNLPVPEVFTQFARASIEADNDLEILLQCGEINDNQTIDMELPSWVPYLLVGSRKMTSNFEPDYCAHGGTAASISFSLDGKELRAKGFIIDALDGVSGRRMYREDDIGGGTADIIPSTQHNSAYGDHSAHEEALWRGLLGNRNRFGTEPTQDYRSVLAAEILNPRFHPPTPTPWTGDTSEALLWNWHLWMTRHSSFTLGGRPLREYLHDRGVSLKDDNQYLESLRRANDFMYSRRLATTNRGYIAVVPQSGVRGDVIAVFLGCSCPILLRPLGQRYKVVNHCYVQGLMNGEAIRDLQGGHSELTEVAIC